MRSVLLIVSLLALLPTEIESSDFKYALGGGAGITSLQGGNFFSFDSEIRFAVSLGYRPSDRWWFDLEYSPYEFSNDINADSTGSLSSLSNNAPLTFRATRLGVLASRLIAPFSRWLHLAAGAGGGLMIWKGVDPATDTAYTIAGENRETVDFSASELFITGSAGIVIRPSPRWSLHLVARVDYLTSAGAEFEESVMSARDRLLPAGLAKLYLHFGGAQKGPKWKSDDAWLQPQTYQPSRPHAGQDSDGDGVSDTEDRCLSTPVGALVDKQGCAVDSDRDGVADGLDHCPETPGVGRQRVDVHGCAVDSDFDGIPDYADACPANAVGAIVGDSGCPVDSDADGVPDGLDDCPYTLVGVDVDKYGCIDLSMFSAPMVLNIDYASGAFDMDPRSRERIKTLAGTLNFVKDIKLEINGYTDNIGTEAANRRLSQKRADRVRSYLVSLGIDAERIKAFGKGESNFIASNQVAEGRAKNRRIEIVFYK